jgi:hypothetical protein
VRILEDVAGPGKGGEMLNGGFVLFHRAISMTSVEGSK